MRVSAGLVIHFHQLTHWLVLKSFKTKELLNGGKISRISVSAYGNNTEKKFCRKQIMEQDSTFFLTVLHSLPKELQFRIRGSENQNGRGLLIH